MREIKFRAWDKIGKQGMLGWSKIIETGIELFFKDNFGFYLMQYTGLKDKQGNEIYEGDIIKWRNTIGDEIKDVVIWSELSHGFSVSRTPEVCCVLSGSDGSHIEVIGNIYENPELLKEPK